MLYLPSLLYSFLYNQYVMQNVVNYLLQISLYLFCLDLGLTHSQQTKWERINVNTEHKSQKFLFEIMTIMVSTNYTGSDTEVILRGMSGIYIIKYIIYIK